MDKPIYTIQEPLCTHTMVLHNKDGKVGELDFNGPTMLFSGNASLSAQIFVDYVSDVFAKRLEQEYAEGFTAGSFHTQEYLW